MGDSAGASVPEHDGTAQTFSWGRAGCGAERWIAHCDGDTQRISLAEAKLEGAIVGGTVIHRVTPSTADACRAKVEAIAGREGARGDRLERQAGVSGGVVIADVAEHLTDRGRKLFAETIRTALSVLVGPDFRQDVTPVGLFDLDLEGLPFQRSEWCRCVTKGVSGAVAFRAWARVVWTGLVLVTAHEEQ